MKNLLLKTTLILSVLLSPLVIKAGDNNKSTVKECLTNWIIDEETIQIDPNDESQFLPGAAFEAQVYIELTSISNVDSITIQMEKVDSKGSYFVITLPIDGSANSSEIFLEKISENTFVLHGGKHIDVEEFIAYTQLTYSDGTKSKQKAW